MAAFRRYIYEFTSFTFRHIRINTHSTHSASQAKHNSARRMNAKEICFARYTTLREILSRVEKNTTQFSEVIKKVYKIPSNICTIFVFLFYINTLSTSMCWKIRKTREWVLWDSMPRDYKRI